MTDSRFAPPSELASLRIRPGSTSAASTDGPAHEHEHEHEQGKQRQARLHRRFDRMARLVGDDAMRRLASAHVVLIGLGGVGSWAAESLVRSGVGRLTLVDFDLVCITNANRQLHALKGTTGKSKATVMAQRLALVNPSCQLRPLSSFYDADSSDAILADTPTLVVDAIDNIKAKAHLIARCRRENLPLVVSGGASGRMDPTAIRESDLAKVRDDPFLAAVRKLLRREYDFPRSGTWDIPAIHSSEAAAYPLDLEYDDGQGFRCVCPQGQNDQHTCDARNLIYGTASFVTGSFGLACAASAVRQILA